MEAFGKHLETSGRHLGGIWSLLEASGNHLGAISDMDSSDDTLEASQRYLEGIQEAPGRWPELSKLKKCSLSQPQSTFLLQSIEKYSVFELTVNSVSIFTANVASHSKHVGR